MDFERCLGIKNGFILVLVQPFRVVQRAVGDCVNGEGDRVKVKFVGEFVSNRIVVALLWNCIKLMDGLRSYSVCFLQVDGILYQPSLRPLPNGKLLRRAGASSSSLSSTVVRCGSEKRTPSTMLHFRSAYWFIAYCKRNRHFRSVWMAMWLLAPLPLVSPYQNISEAMDQLVNMEVETEIIEVVVGLLLAMGHTKCCEDDSEG
nr:TPR repeat-containing protein ZIP4 [Tanacetum cinerariifolium]